MQGQLCESLYIVFWGIHFGRLCILATDYMYLMDFDLSWNKG